MNDKQQAMDKILEFLKSDEKGLLVTGTNIFKKHYLVMAMIDKYYKNAKVLFRINSMSNITNDSFTPLDKQPKAGETVKIGGNFYQFDTFTNKGTWYKTDNNFDLAIVYPVDALCREKNIEPIRDLMKYKNINKLFLCSWADKEDHDYSIFSDYFTKQIMFDQEEQNND